MVMGGLHIKEQHPSLALKCFQEALTVAKRERKELLQAEALREIGQVRKLKDSYRKLKDSYSCI